MILVASYSGSSSFGKTWRDAIGTAQLEERLWLSCFQQHAFLPSLSSRFLQWLARCIRQGHKQGGGTALPTCGNCQQLDNCRYTASEPGGSIAVDKVTITVRTRKLMVCSRDNVAHSDNNKWSLGCEEPMFGSWLRGKGKRHPRCRPIDNPPPPAFDILTKRIWGVPFWGG